MPVYLLHGFRWPRPLIRIHIILQNLDDAAAEWLVARGTTTALLHNLNEIFPDLMQHLPELRFIEQYDPLDTSPGAASQPYAYVADKVHEIRLGVDVEEVRGQGVNNDQWGSMLELRDRLAPEEKVGWYVVVCGDEERWAPSTVSLLQGGGHTGVVTYREQRPQETDSNYSASQDEAVRIRRIRRDDREADNMQQRGMSPEQPAKGLKKWLSKRKRLVPCLLRVGTAYS